MNKLQPSTLLLILVLILYCSSSAQAGNFYFDSIPEAETFVTNHSVSIDGKNIDYQVTAGTMTLRNEENEPIALHGFTYYSVEHDDASTRPIVFAYNGGPGSSSIWLHILYLTTAAFHDHNFG